MYATQGMLEYMNLVSGIRAVTGIKLQPQSDSTVWRAVPERRDPCAVLDVTAFALSLYNLWFWLD